MTCEKMHARIPVATCAGRQTKGIIDKLVNSKHRIPYECRDCEAGRAALAGTPPKIKEEFMAVTRPCANCGRELTIVGNGCCFVCYTAGKGLIGPQRDAALAAVKEKIKSGGLRKGGNRRKPAPAPAAGETKTMSPVKIAEVKMHVKALGAKLAPAGVPEGTPAICLCFIEPRDRTLYAAVLNQAERLRRTPEQQILWMLQNSLEQEMGLLAEASAKG